MTDERLNEIKAALVLSIAEYDNQDAKEMLEIIDRLAAAEKMVNMNPDTFEYDFAYKAWLRACGKAV